MAYTGQFTSPEPARTQIDAMPGLTALEFGTAWCPHCIEAQAHFKSAFDARGDIAHMKIEDGRGRPLGRSFRVKLWPTVVLLRDGEGSSRAEAEAMAQDLVRSGADALLLIPPFAEQLSGSAVLEELGVPLAAIATGTALADVTTVRIDNRGAMEALTRDVIAAGHRRIAYVAGPDHYSVVGARLEGFLAALRAAGLAEEPDLIVRHGAFDYAAGETAARHLLALPSPPSAIICSSDDLAAGVVAEANRQGLQLPARLSVTGFDDTILASRLWPPLTVVRQPVEDMAYRAAQCLIAALGKTGSKTGGKTGSEVSDEVFDHTIVTRASIAAHSASEALS